MITLRQFNISFDEPSFRDLRKRIAETRWPSAPPSDCWDTGTPASALRDVVRLWVDGYDWHTKERELNRYPQYTCEINGASIHFFHIPGKRPGSTPVLMLHGWPDSFLRYAKTFPLLDDYDLIIPSIPGFAFSLLPSKGFVNNSEVADMCHMLMTKILGYRSYVATGGDMGRGVACYMASRYPAEIKGLLLTDVGYAGNIVDAADESLNSDELAYKKAATKWMKLNGAYIGIQSTRPLSLGYGLNDSPAGMAGWLMEKYHDWSDWARFSITDLLDNLTLYWMTGCAQSSVRAYHGNAFSLPPIGKVTVPVGIAQFPADILPVPRSWIERNYNLVQYSTMPYGGHFTAMEAPEAFASALKEFIDRLS